MKAPLIAWVAVWMQLLPVVVAARRWREIDRAHRGLLLWLLLLVAMDLFQRLWVVVLHRGNNLFIEHFATPLQGGLILLVLAEFQVRPVARNTVRIMVPLALAWWAVTTAFFEDTNNFSVLSGPVIDLLALSAALLAFVTRLQDEEVPVLRTSWCWILAGLAIFFATNSAISIFQAVATSRQDWEFLVRSLIYKSGIDILAVTCIAWGFLWPIPPRSSGASSSRPLSP
ncbi:MAG: hypothetical protein K8S21_04385 [Gemmatimonadetes bacterium]|nr:hypothetical protein [Gemmatimonadota bacterium]